MKVLDKAEATSERYIEGTFFLRARVEGNDIGYGSICAAGPHATTLHWVRNDGPVRSGDLLLLDAGVETHASTPPTSRARCRSTARSPRSSARSTTRCTRPRRPVIAAVKPGAKFRDFHDAAQRVLAEKLVEWGLLEGPVEEALSWSSGLQRRWTLHGTGHMLGMDVHDCAAARTEAYVDGDLEPGMVPDGRARSVLPGRRPDRARGVPRHRRPDRGRHPGHRGRQPEPVRRAAPPADEVEAWMAG